MIEQAWLQCNDPYEMLESLRGRSSDRKSRLFAVACCRRVWNRIPCLEGKRAVEVGEAFADGLASGPELEAAGEAARLARPAPPGEGDPVEKGAWLAALHCADPDVFDAATLTSEEACIVPALVAEAAWCARTGDDELPDEKWRSSLADERGRQSAILRDLIGNPFRPVALNPAWLAWQGGKIAKLAQAIYDERASDRLPVLCGALEEAGCADADILSHCRQPSEHVRGCWVVDLLVGKN